MARIEIASHRGGAILWPENSLTAFRNSLSLPVEQLELDVHLSADDTLIVMHDATLDRTTDAIGSVRKYRSEQLKAVRLKGANGECIPVLSEIAALVSYSKAVLRVEIKSDMQGRPYPGIVEKTLDVIEAACIIDRTIIISFSFDAILEAAKFSQLRQTAWLMRPRTWRDLGLDAAVSLAIAHDIKELDFHEADVDEPLVRVCSGAGLSLGAWGVNDSRTMRRMKSLGVNLIATDDPKLALDILR